MIAAYCRVSTTRQAEGHGVDSQKLALTKWAGDRPMVFFEDVGVSGGSQDRPGWNDMMGRVRAGEFSTVVMLDMSRAGRDLSNLLVWVKEVRSLKVAVVFVHDKIDIADDSPTGEFIVYLLAAVAHLNRRLAQEKSKHGVRSARASRRSWGGGLVKDPARNGCSKLTADEWMAAARRVRGGERVSVVAAECGVGAWTLRNKARVLLGALRPKGLHPRDKEAVT